MRRLLSIGLLTMLVVLAISAQTTKQVSGKVFDHTTGEHYPKTFNLLT